MALMEFNRRNFLDTTTSLIVNSNTDTTGFLFDRSVSLAYSSSGFDTDGTSAVVSIVLPTNTVVSNLMLQNHNLQSVNIYYNSVTANSLLATTTNSETSTYLTFASQTVNTIDIQMLDTITPSQEKSIGELIVSNRRLVFERNPAFNDYKPALIRKQIRHEMPDGGITLYNIRNRFRSTLKWRFVTDSFRNSLLTEYEAGLPLYFVPFPTTSGWDGTAYETVWTGRFDFRHANNVKAAGWEGSVLLEQTPGA